MSRFARFVYLGRVNYALFKSPFGWLTLISGTSGLRTLRFGRALPPAAQENRNSVGLALRQLEEYFAGDRCQFEVPLDLEGTPFQLAVWRSLLEIPYGETRSYGAIATAIGRPRAARAVGMANNQNPIPIIVPCHRVIGQNGALTGYAGGLDLKSRLLSLEGALSTKGFSATASDRGLSTAVPTPALF